MDTLQASTESEEKSNVENVESAEKSEKSEIDTAKLEAMVTPEQVLSASVARRRRNLSKKHLNRPPREQTPGRDAVLGNSSDEDARETRPKTPERRRRKTSSKILSASVDRTESLRINNNEVKNDKSTYTSSIVSKDSIPKQEEKRKDSLVSITQQEVVSLFNKAKRSLAQGKEKIRQKKFDKSASKRSQSVPSQFTEKDLIEGLRKANLLDDENNAVQKPYRVYSSESSDVSLAEEKIKPKPYRPIVQTYVAKKKQQRQSSSKIIEILDPKTAKVIGKITKGPPAPPIRLFDVLKILRYFTILEIYRFYKKFKREQYKECERIRRLKNRCICDLMLILIMCGLGGIMFKNVEGAFEDFYKCGVKRVKRDFIDVLWYRSHNMREEEWKSLARNKLRTFEDELHTAHEAGMHSYSGQRSWSFLNGIIYCITVITTMGYGHIYPQTTTGQALTIVYALIGIPLFLIALTDFEAEDEEYKPPKGIELNADSKFDVFEQKPGDFKNNSNSVTSNKIEERFFQLIGNIERITTMDKTL
ncbi:hypothetical protein ILUMI_07802 [Ignelater luminosus]|uniref:Potassium channel domain-containing protein n=1 Tax=Ignelater luminosus TaxID=2038154 RepID=A0A8K0D363_IGNLU|nr:hypothetical protein ILUMI_07802 [Ignelater luminosus]